MFLSDLCWSAGVTGGQKVRPERCLPPVSFCSAAAAAMLSDLSESGYKPVLVAVVVLCVVVLARVDARLHRQLLGSDKIFY